MDKVINKTEDVIAIFKAIENHFPDCDYSTQDNLIWVRRKSVLLHILDFNTLKYYHDTNQLEEHLKSLEI